MFTIALKVAKNTDAAEDIVQDSIVKAATHWDKFRHECPVRGWLGQIVFNTARTYLRQQKDFVDLESLPLEAPSADDKYQHLTPRLREEIDKLSPKQKIVMELFYYRGLSLVDVAIELNCPYNTAKANYRHALGALKKAFAVNA